MTSMLGASFAAIVTFQSLTGENGHISPLFFLQLEKCFQSNVTDICHHEAMYINLRLTSHNPLGIVPNAYNRARISLCFS